MHTGFSVVSREKFQSHPALTLLLEILLDSSFQLFSNFLKEPHAESCKRRDPIVSYLDLILAGLLFSLQSAPFSALTSSKATTVGSHLNSWV